MTDAWLCYYNICLLFYTFYMLKTIGELQELITTLYIGFLGLIFSSYFVYLSEKETSLYEKNFES